ncbi:hypothetical protein BaRGS_00038210, partial [Batillaria attramentaria]
MDLRQLVQKKLPPGEKCLQCIEAARIVDDKRLLRIVAIAEKQDEHACLFLILCLFPPTVHSQNAAFGTAPSFDWLAKYRNKVGGSNPFAEDVFDPMKYMNLEGTNLTVSVGQEDRASTSRSTWFTSSDELHFNGQGMAAARGMTFGSRDSLDGVSNREAVARQILTDREDEFVDLKTVRLFCGTWNVNGQSPSESLSKWLVVDQDPPDIYAIGFQELDLSREAFIFSESAREAEWQEAVKTYLHPRAKYRKVKSVRLVGILLIVYIKEELCKYVSFIDCDSVATVSWESWVTKAVCLTIETFIPKTRFKQFAPPLTIDEHDLVFWIGDLNYRLAGQLDELYNQLGSTGVFQGFTEGTISFDPTYKFDPGTDTYDTSEKSRTPAWCDRILWKGNGIQQLRYDAHPELRISDHKPVSSVFNVGIKVIDEKRYKKVYEDIMKKLDRIENEYLPQIKLDKTECHFRDVKFIEPQVEVITIANVGQKLDDTRFCKPWLTVTPCKSVIKPGLSCDVQVEVYVDKSTVTSLNCGKDNLEDILVLHLHGGKDIFITVSGNYLSSSFGSSIEALIQMHGPIRNVPVAQLVQIEQTGSLTQVDLAETGGRLYMVPKELWRLVDHIVVNGKEKENLFQVPGLQSEIQQIRDALDTGVPEVL